ncbi:hypothetical protein [Synechococcus sp. CCY 9618]|uniref:hypothetical protein n=1 Tax=Synechococcus sp. CCY 9618 TaxID=2815602 RepID=UPI001C23B761|nr:hypothetical protein [Synechococcus sp. CCY 9618]
MATDQESFTPEQMEQAIAAQLLTAQLALVRASLLTLRLLADESEATRWRLMAADTRERGELTMLQKRLTDHAGDVTAEAHGRLCQLMAPVFAGPPVDR